MFAFGRYVYPPVNALSHALSHPVDLKRSTRLPVASLALARIAHSHTRVPRKCVRVPSRSRTHARLYTKIDTPSERECPLPPPSLCGGAWEAAAALVMREPSLLNRLNLSRRPLPREVRANIALLLSCCT